MTLFDLWLIGAFFGLCVGFIAGARKNYSPIIGAGLGFILSWGSIGLFAVDRIFPTQHLADTRACPWCAEIIKRAAVVCKHCGRDVVPAESTNAKPEE
jgi:hypothetical protein